MIASERPFEFQWVGPGQTPAAARNAAHLAAERYDKGVTSYLEVLETERTLFSVELELSELMQTYLNSYVRLYKSLGGGWGTGSETDREGTKEDRDG